MNFNKIKNFFRIGDDLFEFLIEKNYYEVFKKNLEYKDIKVTLKLKDEHVFSNEKDRYKKIINRSNSRYVSSFYNKFL